MPAKAAKRITALTLPNIKPKAARYAIPDGTVPGLAVVVQPSGAKSWSFRYRLRRDGVTVQERATLGPVKVDPASDGAGLDIGAARTEAQRLLGLADAGTLPGRPTLRQEARAERCAAAAARACPELVQLDTVKAIWDDYVSRRLTPKAKPGTVKRFEGVARRCFLSSWGERRLPDITIADVRGVLNAAPGPEARNSAIVVLSSFFNWAKAPDQGLIDRSPVDGFEKTQEPSRERALSDAEIKLFWQGCDKLGPVMGPMFQLMLLTGQRRNEVAGMRWSEVGDRYWTIPAARTKTRKGAGKPHDVFLTDEAVAALATIKKIKDCDFVFSTNGTSPSSGFSKAKAALDKLTPDLTEPYTLHDLRRSFTTGCARIGVPEAIVDRCLNHSGKKVSGVAAIYNRFDYAAEMHDVWKTWGDHIAALMAPYEQNQEKSD